MRCWKCSDRDEASAIGLCADCRRDLDAEKLVPPGRDLLAPGTLPEEVGPYRVPTARDFMTVIT